MSIVNNPRLLAVLLLLCCLTSLAVAADQFAGQVVGILDGDTIRVMRDGSAVKVRLWGIDAPEKAQPFGQLARTVTAGLVFQQAVTVVPHGSDRYGRLLGEVLLWDGRNLGQELVRMGLAWHYVAFAKHDHVLAAFEQEARAARRGLWQEDHPIAPWEWRRMGKKAGQASASSLYTDYSAFL